MEFKNSWENSDRKMHSTSYSTGKITLPSPGMGIGDWEDQERKSGTRLQGHIQKQVKRKSDIDVQECDLDTERMFYPLRYWTGCGSVSVFYHIDLKLVNSKLSSETEKVNHLNPQSIQGGYVQGPGHYYKGRYK